MTRAELDKFLAAPRNAIVAVNRPGAAPQVTPVWYAWDGATFRFSTTRGRAKYINIKRDPAISLIVDDIASHTYVMATGRASIIEENIATLTRPILEKYIPADRLQQSIEMLMKEDRVLVVLRPEKLIVNGQMLADPSDAPGA